MLVCKSQVAHECFGVFEALVSQAHGSFPSDSLSCLQLHRGAKTSWEHPLLADVGGETAKNYGTFQEEKGYASRVLFVIDKQGKLQKIIEGIPDNNELLEVLKSIN